jgi:hypothetical protein
VRVEAEDAARVVGLLGPGGLRMPAIVQPFVAEIATAGEWSLVFVERADPRDPQAAALPERPSTRASTARSGRARSR